MEGEKIMTTSKEAIIGKLKENRKSRYLVDAEEGENKSFEKPDLTILEPLTFENPLLKFIEVSKASSGAEIVDVNSLDNINQLIHKLYPDVKVIGSNLNYIEAAVNPDSISDKNDLMHVDVGVVEGCFGVAENGCVWINQTMKERGICFASEYLVIILKKDSIVNNMHEAYAKIAENPEYFDVYKFGTFISGPSKTADIESALVFGAQAARGVTIILI